MPITETRQLASGARLDLETHTSPGGLTGVVAHWGVRYEDYDLRERIADSYKIPKDTLPRDTGFEVIYRQADGITRDAAITDELSVAMQVVTTTIEANGWKPEDIDALHVGSGVPVVDDPNIPNYAQEIAKRSGMRENISMHNTYAACSSGAHEFLTAAADPDLNGKKVLILGMEGITALTPDFDPERSDHLSMQVFSNAAAGIGIIPGEDIQLFGAPHHSIIEDGRGGGALAARMHYEHLIDPENPDIWQEIPGTSVIRMPRPEGDRLLRMRGKETTIFFVRNGLQFIGEVYNRHMSAYPESRIEYAIAHHASKGVNEVLGNNLRRQGLEIEIPWVINDGNSSAATTLAAQNRLLERAAPGTRVMLLSYGAGASFDGAVMEYGQRG